jgi:hypothetical protein
MRPPDLIACIAAATCCPEGQTQACATCSAAAEEKDAPVCHAHPERRPGQGRHADDWAGEVQPDSRRQVELRRRSIRRAAASGWAGGWAQQATHGVRARPSDEVRHVWRMQQHDLVHGTTTSAGGQTLPNKGGQMASCHVPMVVGVVIFFSMVP